MPVAVLALPERTILVKAFSSRDDAMPSRKDKSEDFCATSPTVLEFFLGSSHQSTKAYSSLEHGQECNDELWRGEGSIVRE
ncbi:hypothetical protein ANCCEY_13983, partial [Ancylostoma ceylanicum]